MKNPVFLLAPDSFKESMTAKEVCAAMEAGIKKAIPDAVCIQVPMADGGEGTVQSLVDATGGTIYQQTVTGPLGHPVTACYGILGDGETAVIEMASASGIHLVTKETKNPLVTTTYGTGELIKACLDKKVKQILIGIGGSATNDGGAGMAQALGAKFLDERGGMLPFGGGALGDLAEIDLAGLDPRLKEVQIFVASDVTNPLCGENGASHVFGPQKGATKEMVALLDTNLSHYAAIIKEQLGKDVAEVPGAGAAGGLGAGLMVFTDAVLKSGIELVVEYTGLEQKVKDADIVLTGEGSIDFQTQFGKAPYGVARAAKKHGKPVIAVAGYVGEQIDVLYEKGIDAIFGILPRPMALEDALQTGATNIERTCENIARLLVLAKQ
ncbi:glycerate kinase [Heyndrickxia coagulans]|nr:glycerate kinase [Heyndrickxia coagulans]MCR2847692.1 glycerate kinase [Heyndrickxia coagulans]MDR4225427.1 glycerate kinase [Heyndrickxia coagulans DSM 1 = ATCC 7050]MED4495277.1 glycerate kinase [Heyndrickxia coagulans]MED4535840.1 glycerate kinase [Heyndrickxia coagulans]MED4934746.1 glycerate kinase [Heyndrickxia coagulans]